VDPEREDGEDGEKRGRGEENPAMSLLDGPEASPRTALTRWAIGLIRTNCSSHTSIDAGSTKTLLARRSGNRMTSPMMVTEFGVRTRMPTQRP
jgi:hypothetical protein